MIFLALSILSSTAIFVLFKLFDTYKIDTLQAIVINYITASICGFLLSESSIGYSSLASSGWFIPAVILGVMFITMFYLMALTAQRNGLSVASVASKMSVIIPVVFGIIVFKESLGYIKAIGIILALMAVYLTSINGKSQSKNHKPSLWLPFLVFFGSGIIDTSINYFAPDNNIPVFSATIFAMAAFVGTIIIVVRQIRKKEKIGIKALPFGAALGIVNYGSVYFLLNALRVEGTETSSIFTINNVAIVALSTLCGLFLFREVISIKNWIGIGFAMVSIVIISLQ